MGSSTQFNLSLFSRLFAEKADKTGCLSFADFMELSLYAPQIGYYVRKKLRVGRQSETDFYTSSSLDTVFPLAITSAATEILSPNEPAKYTLVEIGAEPNAGLFQENFAPFKGGQTVQLESPLSIPENSVVISNELFDAQPFHRLIQKDGQWREQGVHQIEGSYQWTLLDHISDELEEILPQLPQNQTEGYTLDLPVRARHLLEKIAQKDWKGLFIAFDYGKSWPELSTECPAGTGRAYHRHQQNNDLLHNPTEQDLTCHICWDWLSDTLLQQGFTSVELFSQEAFFIKKAQKLIASTFTDYPDPLSKPRSQLKQLLHPTLMGQKFQVLVGKRL
ncbi:MAG: SAM-dependent methyltransferase [Opitutaceae bacterium]|nr:SAM-dependent methyltransferase [Opitutaceae bacterium]